MKRQTEDAIGCAANIIILKFAAAIAMFVCAVAFVACCGGLFWLGDSEAPKKGEPKQLQSNPQSNKPGTQGEKEEKEPPARIGKQSEKLPAPVVDEKAAKERLEKERQRQQEERERKADAKLSLALDLENNNRPEAAKRWFQEILRDFPGTKAAEKAAEHLKGL